MSSQRNVFRLSRRHNDEDQLTEMLFWLVSAVPEVGSALLALAFESTDVSVLRLPEMQTSTQVAVPEGCVDGFIAAGELALAIESKLDSGFHSGQLGKYARWLASRGEDSPITRRALMTVTKVDMPWPRDDVKVAASLGVVAVRRRWADVHARLRSVAADLSTDDLGGRLVIEFTEMLEEEGLIPMDALTDHELGTAWLEARGTIERMCSFLRSCTEEIEAMSGARSTARWSEHVEWTYREFDLPGGGQLAVGLDFSDHAYVREARLRTGEPVVWVQVTNPTAPNWGDTANWLVAHPPQDWNAQLRSNARPRVWRRVREVLSDTMTIEEQRRAIAELAQGAIEWLHAGLKTT